MSVFRPSQSYRADLDIRLGGGRTPYWIGPPTEGRAPNSAAWLVVMPRRAGKTWLAHGIAGARPDGSTFQVDLRSSVSIRRTRLGCLTGTKAAPPVGDGHLVVVDEPALARPGGPGVDPAVLADGLNRIRDAGATSVVFATPAEHALLLPHLGPDAPKDVLRPPVLDDDECARMAARAPHWAPPLVAWLRDAEPGWLHTPFLLELALHTAEDRPELRSDPEALLRAAVEEADDRHEYIRQWFHNGLAEEHRVALRSGRWRAAGLPLPPPPGRTHPAHDPAPGRPRPFPAAPGGPNPFPAAPGRPNPAQDVPGRPNPAQDVPGRPNPAHDTASGRVNPAYERASGRPVPADPTPGRTHIAHAHDPATGRPANGARSAAALADDPVLARYLPEVLRVHHISDLHHGGRLSTTVDGKDRTQAGRRFAEVAGAGTALDSYLDHVRQLAAQGRAPHLVIVTGDIVDRPSDAHGEQARDWLEQLAALLADHRDLRADDPRVLLVGGNHDVSWDLALDPSAQARHRWFAAAFADRPHPDLHLADPRARRLYVGYPGAGLRFALLGSAESGGEAARDEDRERLRELQRRFAAADAGPDGESNGDSGAGPNGHSDSGPNGAQDSPRDTAPEGSALTGGAATAALVRDFERYDPGVVARGVLDRLAAEPGYVTVGALHHPLSPVPAVEVAPYTGVLNAGHTKRALAAAGTALVLHGHTHLGFAAAERLLGAGPPWTMRIAGAPALASRETEERNGYNELFVAREGGAHTLAVRTVRLDGGQWTPGQVFAFRPGAAEERDLAALCADG